MTWTPSPRPPWSEWLMNLILREATPVMNHPPCCCAGAVLLPGRLGDRIEGETLRLLANLGHGNGGDREQHGNQRHDRAEPVILLQDGDEKEVGGGAETTAARGEAEAGRSRVGREHLRSEDLH